MRKLLMTLAVFALAGGLVLAAGKAVEPATGVQAVTAESPCPVAACASGACHGFDDVPEPDGVARDDVPRGGLRERGVPCVGLPDNALPPGEPTRA